MPKMKKEKLDEIAALLGEGYTNGEIANKAGVSAGTVSRIRGRMGTGGVKNAEGTVPTPLAIPMSRESIDKLYAIQGLLSCATLDDAVDILYKDLPKIMAYKFRANLDFHGTPAEVFTEAVERLRLLEDTSPLCKDPDRQGNVLALMGLTWFAKGLHGIEGRGETLLRFMERKLMEQYEEEGWSFNIKRRDAVLKMDASLANEIYGDLVSIISPSGLWYFPGKEEACFGVQTEPMSDKVILINVNSDADPFRLGKRPS